MSNILKTHVAPLGLDGGAILMDALSGFAGSFQSLLDEFVIRHDRTPPWTPRYNRVIEWALCLLSNKTIALLRGVTEGNIDQLGAEVINHACGMSKGCVTTSVD